MRVRVQRSATMTCAGCGETEADGAIFESADGRCFRCNRPALQIPNAEVKAPPPKRRKCGPSLSKTRSAEEAAAHAIKMRQLPATEKAVYATRSPQAAAAHAIKMREMLAAEKAEVRPDFVVLLCRRAYVLMLCRKHAGRSMSGSCGSGSCGSRCVRTSWSVLQA